MPIPICHFHIAINCDEKIKKKHQSKVGKKLKNYYKNFKRKPQKRILFKIVSMAFKT